MERREQRLDTEQLRAMGTGELVRLALEEARLLARAEVMHAKQELRDELAAVRRGAIAGGAAVALALCGAALMFVAVAVALPMPEPLAAVLVGAGLWLVAAVLGLWAWKKVPRKPLPVTQDRLRSDVRLAKGQLT